MKIRKYIFSLVCIAIFLIPGGFPQSVHAVATLKLDDGSSPIIIVEDGDEAGVNGAEYTDENSEDGAVGFYGTLGIFNLNLDAWGTLLGSTTYPIMNLSSGIVSSGSESGTLDIWFSEVGYGSSTGFFETTVGGGTRGTSVSFSSYIDQTNTLFGVTTPIGSISSISGSDVSDPYSLSYPYSLTTLATITHGSGSVDTSFAMNVTTVPEPVSSALFLIGGTFMGARLCLKRKK